jgi:hypothetical protein
MVKSYRKKPVAMVSRAAETLYTLSNYQQLHLLLPGPTAMSCAPRAL